MAATTMRTAMGWASLIYAVQAVVLMVVLIGTARVVALPIEAGFGDGERTVTTSLGAVDLGWALVAMLLGGGAAHALAAAGARPGAARAEAAQPGALVVAGWSQGLGILIFLIARLNGIADPVALIPLFALGAGSVCLLGIDDGSSPRRRRPTAWAAVLGIVPWGVIAFAQVGATITSGAPAAGVRIVTIAALAVAAIGWWIAWRRPRAARPSDVAVMTVALSAITWAIVVLIVLGLPPHENG
ncbi:hypothetical protein ACEXQD_03450 [Herbiconiux sp. P15]|uniref:hypothetical protein n=1 Tax=Herbiconiux liukaitaii TaxID=3342799 RepID=UPI0035B82E0E